MHRLLVLFVVALALAVVAPGGASAATRSTAATTPTRTIDADGVKLGYRSFGSGPPILFIMGLSGTMDGWDPRFLDAVVAQGRRVIVFDNQGMGRSGTRRGELTIARMADDAAALLRALRVRRADVFSWSMGGMIGQSMAVRHPRVVRRLVLAASAPGDGKVVPSVGRGAEVLVSRTESPLSALDTLFPPAAAAARERYAEAVALRRRARPVGPRSTIDKQLIASAGWLNGSTREGARVKRLRMPVLVAGGAHDELLPVGNSRYLASVIPRAQLVVYDDASHAFWSQKRDVFVKRMERFLG